MNAFTRTGLVSGRMTTHATIKVLGLGLTLATILALLGNSEAQAQGRGGRGGSSPGRHGGGSSGGGHSGFSPGKHGGGSSGGKPQKPDAVDILNGVGNMVGTIISSIPDRHDHYQHSDHYQHHGHHPHDDGDYTVYYVDSDDDSECYEVQPTYYAESVPSVSSVPSNPLPPANITLVNPKKNGATLEYTLNGERHSLAPGFKQEVHQVCEIEFDKGGSAGSARYTISEGTYTFTSVKGAWDLFQKTSDDTKVPEKSSLASNPVPAE